MLFFILSTKTMAKSIIHYFLLITNLVLLTHSYNVPAIFIFGDSIFDAGNNHFIKNCTVQANFRPYGFNFFHHPTGRFTNGRTVADFIAQFLGLEFQLPYRQVLGELRNGTRMHYPCHGLNFASAGSGLLQETNENMGVTSIQAQVQLFQALIQQNHIDKKTIKNSLFLLESGSNDIFNYFLRFETPKSEPNQHIQNMLAEVQSFVNHIYQLGARRIAVFSLGPVGCAPGRAVIPQAPLGKCFGKMNRMVKDFNHGLENMINYVPVQYPGAIGVFGDVYAIVQQLRATPSRYGFVEVLKACCGNGPLGGTIQCGREGYKLCPNPNQFLFWDFFHPSERTSRLTAKSLWGGRRQRIRPYNLRTLVSISPY